MRSLFSTEAPLLFHQLPEQIRHRFVRNHLGPAPGWVVRDQVMGHVRFHTGVTVKGAEMHGQRVLLHAMRSDGEREIIEADHAVAATGFNIDLRRVPFLSADRLANLQMEDNKPTLSTFFESSISGLYFVGPAAAFSLGPLLRFAYGAGFAAGRVSRHLAPTEAKPQRIWSQAVSPAPASQLKA